MQHPSSSSPCSSSYHPRPCLFLPCYILRLCIRNWDPRQKRLAFCMIWTLLVRSSLLLLYSSWFAFGDLLVSLGNGPVEFRGGSKEQQT
ncbi:hypothetical protein BO94DRAFT_224775 [Aspergillus sclerotioniger CBS 115572]|uniref:Uncharacterized protein n=1 Tax=Aspergillus sclerotioniger CBS 115572 TaxID=1450535 RepID=A0A317X9U6_9EURO|nr:hypothetical protein BO94DRAFT_224775 [Aspergillus sclerotioniger CBS 115572]PWY95314.1 hypothetical protein BO94DRAFT_224775 [Aspergillus sclerotioniger CBS 115572]